MRNGAKDILDFEWLAKRLFLLAILFILGLLIIFAISKIKIHSTKLNILNYFININDYKTTSNEYATITLDEDLTNTPQITYSTTEVAKKFANANAIVIGDSTAEGLSAYNILNSNNVIWTRGRVVQYMQDDLEKADDYFTPNIIFLSYGVNDLLSWQENVDGFISSYKKAVGSIKEKFPNAKICINSVLPVSNEALSKNPDFGYEGLYNEKLEEYCNLNGLIFIDNRDFLKQNNNGKIYESDGIHPKYFYYPLWASNMAVAAGL